jgi:DNA-binding GntR family transcriptional regulator
VPDHKEMAAAARARDAEGAALALANHLARAASVVVASMDPGWDLTNVRRALKERRAVAQLASNVTKTNSA